MRDRLPLLLLFVVLGVVGVKSLSSAPPSEPPAAPNGEADAKGRHCLTSAIGDGALSDDMFGGTKSRLNASALCPQAVNHWSLSLLRAFRNAVLNCGKQLYTCGLGLSIVPVKDEFIGKVVVAWSMRWLEVPAGARTP